MVVDAGKGVGLYGESMLADSYAVYTFLDQLGCRWFMPGELGEIIPQKTKLVVEEIKSVRREGQLAPMTRQLYERQALLYGWMLSQIEGLTYQQIADRLQVSLTTVKKHMIRALTECSLIMASR